MIEQLNSNSRERIHGNSEAKGTVIHPQDVYKPAPSAVQSFAWLNPV